jgi:DNA-binding PadR family transcriptional regulator
VGSGQKDRELQGPLTPAMFHILLALADGEKHGYAILKEVAERTGGKVQLSAGTLYGIIKRLDESGLILEKVRRPDIGFDDERRRYYQLTELGRRVAVAEAARLEEMVEMARAKRLVRRPRLA